jgi:hypothetical protein
MKKATTMDTRHQSFYGRVLRLSQIALLCLGVGAALLATLPTAHAAPALILLF